MVGSAAATATASLGRHTKLGQHRPTKHLPNRLKRVLDRTPYFKRNSGGCVIFGWNCALQDISSEASHTSALRLIASWQMRAKRCHDRFGAMRIAARRTILIGRWLAPALILEPAAATYINASREGFTPRQPALTGNGGE